MGISTSSTECNVRSLYSICYSVSPQTTASLLQAVMVSEVKSTFYKINVHAALTPDQIWGHLQPAIKQADSLREAYEQGEDKGASLRLPFVTVRTPLESLSFISV